MALAIIVLAAGFAPDVLCARPPIFRRCRRAALLHGIAGTAWLSLFAIQCVLIATSRVEWHRRLGVFGVVLAMAFVVSGIAVIAGLEGAHIGESGAALAAHCSRMARH